MTKKIIYNVDFILIVIFIFVLYYYDPIAKTVVDIFYPLYKFLSNDPEMLAIITYFSAVLLFTILVTSISKIVIFIAKIQ